MPIFNAAGNIKYEYAFVDPNPLLQAIQINYIVERAIKMYSEKIKEDDFKTGSLEGRISTKGEYKMIGTMGGLLYSAVFEGEKIKGSCTFILSDKPDYYSPN